VEVSANMVKDLREKTGAGMMDCKKALTETGGDFQKAVDFLRQKGLATAAKRAGRIASEGRIGSYIHAGGKIGVMVEVNCETDFVAKTDDFRQLVKDVALHIASPSAPRFLHRDDVPRAELDDVRRIAEVQAKDAGKPENVIEKIVTGKIDAHIADVVLLEQPFVKDDSKTVQGLLDEVSAKVGERIAVRRFARFRLGEAEYDEATGGEGS
jgi:elongation factor Ts